MSRQQLFTRVSTCGSSTACHGTLLVSTNAFVQTYTRVRDMFSFFFFYSFIVFNNKLLLVINIPADMIWEFFLLYIFRYWSFWLGDVSCQLQLDGSNVLHWEREIGYWVSERKINSFSLLLQSHSRIYFHSAGVLTFNCK